MDGKTPGERLHELITAFWGDHPPLSQWGGFSALGDDARMGWEDIARRIADECAVRAGEHD